MKYVIEVSEAISPQAYNRNSVLEREILAAAFSKAKPLVLVDGISVIYSNGIVVDSSGKTLATKIYIEE